MKDTLDTLNVLLASKRFLVTMAVVIALGAFVLAGKMPAADFITSLKQLGGLLSLLYGAENVAIALKGPPT